MVHPWRHITVFLQTALFAILLSPSLFGDIHCTAPSAPSAPSHWPESITYPDDITVEIVEEKHGSEGSVYRSNHYELISDNPLTISALCDVLRILEANYASLQALPISFAMARPEERCVVKLVDSEKRYVQHGGILGTGGIYLPESREALLHINRLGAEFDDSGRIRSIQHHGVIAHEVTHQLQHDWLGTLPTWLIEGLAVYLESVPYHNGTLLFEQMDFRAEKNLRRSSENHFWITGVERLMSFQRSEWNAQFEAHPESNSRDYVSAFLLTYYFLHLNENDAGTALPNYIASMQRADSPQARTAALSTLMQGRSYQELEKDMIEAYAKEGFTIETFVGYARHLSFKTSSSPTACN